ncbi:hypothetical protein DER45DRAFT_615494 [Fusarium avenaceum]|nr:hypothetical protein DER45DRAFT_615494 [Fusarium avenaceum]
MVPRLSKRSHLTSRALTLAVAFRVASGDESILGDGHRPLCQECDIRHVECVWGLKVSFHPSRALYLSSEDKALLSRLDKQREKAQPQERAAPLIDIVRSFYAYGGESSLGDETDGEPPQQPFQEQDEGSSTIIVGDEPLYADTTPNNLERNAITTSVRHKAFEPFIPPPLVPYFSPPPNIRVPQLSQTLISGLPVAPFSLGQAISRGTSPEPEPRFPVSQATKISLMTAYIKETATWCETTDSEMHFSARSVHEMMNSKHFVAAAMSLASRQLDAVQGCRRPITLELYQYTIRLLIGQSPAKADSSVLAICTILCAYEMMASSVPEWRRHLRGCADLLRMCKWNGNSEGIVKSCFWAFARIDIWAAFILNQTTLIPTDSWVDNGSLLLAARKGDTDDYLCGNTFYHAGSILLLQSGLVKVGDFSEGSTCNPHWHARELAGISISNSSHANWVNHLQPLYIAGKVFGDVLVPGREDGDVSPRSGSGGSRQIYIGLAGSGSPVADTVGDWNSPSKHDDFPAEKIALLRHLAKIERETGWKTSDRARDLRMLWGLEN